MTKTVLSRRLALLSLCAAPFFGAPVHGQGFSIEHGGALAQDGVGVVPVADGFLVGVRDFALSPAAHGIVIWKAGSDGSNQSTTEVEALTGQLFVQGFIASADGGQFLFGSVIPEGGHEHDGFVIKLDADGDIIWSIASELPSDDHFLGAAALADGGLAVCGTTRASGDHDALMARFAPDGTLLWSVSEGFESDEEAYALAVLGNDLMVTGRQLNFGGTGDAWFARVTTDGEVLWTTSWGGIGDDIGRAIIANGPGSFIMAGTTDSYGSYDQTEHRIKRNTYLIAIDLNGDSLWTRALGDTLFDRQAFSLAAAPNGDLLIAGERATIAGVSDSYALRTDANGGLIWERAWDLGKEERLLAIESLPDGFVATGWAFGDLSRQVTLVRRDPNGN
ncbi:MAG: hypothetical protein H6591_11700 [Flavobacteriales bacterium]|nr:hypothetical protein [Flavobacteriales bacterium]